MKIPFFKYQATGNDFVMIDNINGSISLTQKQVAFLCDRRLGIGSDGLILLESISREKTCDTLHAFRMRFYNPDGSSGMFCGNGGRAIVAFAQRCGISSKDGSYYFAAPDQDHSASIISHTSAYEWQIKLSLTDVIRQSIKDYEDGIYLNTGTNHFVTFVSDIDRVLIDKQGSAIRYDKRFEHLGGTNCNFIQEIEKGSIAIRTYERGVEGETLSCGTGITASAIAYVEKNNLDINFVKVKARGGDLIVSFEKDAKGDYTCVCLQGQVKEVFSGEVEL